MPISDVAIYEKASPTVDNMHACTIHWGGVPAAALCMNMHIADSAGGHQAAVLASDVRDALRKLSAGGTIAAAIKLRSRAFAFKADQCQSVLKRVYERNTATGQASYQLWSLAKRRASHAADCSAPCVMFSRPELLTTLWAGRELQ